MLAVALVPGALYIWSFESVAGRWGVVLSDRLVRFLGASAIIHAILAPVTYWLWSSQWSVAASGEAGWMLWFVPASYVAGPLVIGALVGRASLEGRRWARWFTGPRPAPRAWDFLFRGERDGWVRLRLKSGGWLAGAYATADGALKSYSAGYPEEQDLFLSTSAEVDPETGEFRFDDTDRVVLRPGGLLVRWEEVEYLEFIDA